MQRKILGTFVSLLLFLGFLSSCNLSAPINQEKPNGTEQPSKTSFDCQSSLSPWEISWLPNSQGTVTQQINNILTGTGLAGFGSTIIQAASEYQVNPAFALAMFRKEASFATLGTRANRNNNPGNIIATGDCSGKPAGASCSGVYGETSTDGRFGVYPSMDAGIQAYFRLLNQEYATGSKRNCTDTACIIQAYCPPSDCNTQGYIDQITSWSKDYQCQIYESSSLPIVSSSQMLGLTAGSSTIPPTQPQGINTNGGKIAFTSDRDGNNEIYIMDADGSEQTNITNSQANDMYPSWSPDGQKIAFSSDRDGNSQIYVINTEGSSIFRLTNNQGNDVHPSFSPDGQKIAFESDRGGKFEIYVMNDDGTDQTRLTYDQALDGDPSWSPDGQKIAFDSFRNGNWEIYIIGTDGNNLTRLTNGQADGVDPAWSPDGQKIAFESFRDGNSQIYVMNSDGSNQTRITNNQSHDEKPAWSPDGQKIAYESYNINIGGNTQIYVINADGSNQNRLTNDQASEMDPNWLK